MQQGLSLRSLFWAAGSELILFFYLIEEKSSKLVCVCAHARARVFVCERPPIRRISWQQSSPPHP